MKTIEKNAPLSPNGAEFFTQLLSPLKYSVFTHPLSVVLLSFAMFFTEAGTVGLSTEAVLDIGELRFTDGASVTD